MLFRTITGELISIQRKDYATDIEYYRNIMMIIDPNVVPNTDVTHFSSLRAIDNIVTLEKTDE